MAGRSGRGRGRSTLTFNLEDVGIGRGESLPPATLKPSLLFPPLTFQPVPLQTGEEVEYMLALKQELRTATKNLPFYIRRSGPKKDVDRYSDKYQTQEPQDSSIEWNPDWGRLPKELCIQVRKPQQKGTSVQGNRPKKTLMGKEEIIAKLEKCSITKVLKFGQLTSSAGSEGPGRVGGVYVSQSPCNHERSMPLYK
ncbi:DNA-directed RNA polymerase III subunit RPC7-like [Aplochiton taeniatus]